MEFDAFIVGLLSSILAYLIFVSAQVIKLQKEVDRLIGENDAIRQKYVAIRFDVDILKDKAKRKEP